MKKLIGGGLMVLAIGLGMAPIASARPPTINNCRTDVMSSSTYTYCTYTDDSGSYRIVTVCMNGHCSTREAH